MQERGVLNIVRCVDCPKGFYQDASQWHSETTCKQCTLGTYASAVKSVTCTIVLRSYASAVKSVTCTDCSAEHMLLR